MNTSKSEIVREIDTVLDRCHSALDSRYDLSVETEILALQTFREEANEHWPLPEDFDRIVLDVAVKGRLNRYPNLSQSLLNLRHALEIQGNPAGHLFGKHATRLSRNRYVRLLMLVGVALDTPDGGAICATIFFVFWDLVCQYIYWDWTLNVTFPHWNFGDIKARANYQTVVPLVFIVPLAIGGLAVIPTLMYMIRGYISCMRMRIRLAKSQF